MTQSQFDVIRKIVEDVTGIIYEDGDMEFMIRRLKPLALRFGCKNFEDFLEKAKKGTTVVRNNLVDAVTTRETLWFRDRYFEPMIGGFLLPKLAKEATSAGRSKLKIWSAASSSGQEAYSLAILLAEGQARGELGTMRMENCQIKGTDISMAALESARRGRYDGVAMARGLPPLLKSKYFDALESGYQVKERLRRLTSFDRLNLLQMDHRRDDFDMVLLRNVLIYFTKEARAKILDRMATKIRPGGVLIVGGSEDPLRYSKAWTRERMPGGTGAYFTPKH
ncbi:MAG: protein-glutamate O-methyltransferase CheR [Planctomycetota bacterium]|nr:protein-glutamate O-methyltransferase CheR [Planctomycetota bacterium]